MGLRLGLAGAAISAVLLGLLVWFAGPEAGHIVALLAAVPPALLVGVAALEAVALLAGAQKWRLSVAWFRPAAGRPPLWRSLEATALGGVFAQFLPAQLATASARALLQRRHAGAGMAVWATLHEQLFDLLALGAVGVVAGVLLLAGGTAALAAGTGAALAGVLGAGLAFRVAGAATARLAGARHEGLAGRLTRALAEAGRLPWRIAAALMALSLVRVGCWTLRAVLVFAVLVPAAPWPAVALAFPAVQLATVLPMVPGGLGTVEWVWAGTLAAAGVPTAEAAAAALALRAVLMAGFALLLAAMLCVALLAGLRPKPPGQAGAETTNR